MSHESSVLRDLSAKLPQNTLLLRVATESPEFSNGIGQERTSANLDHDTRGPRSSDLLENLRNNFIDREVPRSGLEQFDLTGFEKRRDAFVTSVLRSRYGEICVSGGLDPWTRLGPAVTARILHELRDSIQQAVAA